MNAPNDNTAPPRTGMRRLIPRFEFRHLRGVGAARIAGGGVGAFVGLVCLSSGVYGFAAFFLVIGALNVAGGCWYLSIARSAAART